MAHESWNPSGILIRARRAIGAHKNVTARSTLKADSFVSFARLDETDVSVRARDKRVRELSQEARRARNNLLPLPSRGGFSPLHKLRVPKSHGEHGVRRSIKFRRFAARNVSRDEGKSGVYTAVSQRLEHPRVRFEI